MKKVFIEEARVKEFAEYITERGISIGVVGDLQSDTDLKIKACGGDILESSLTVLYSGGWISCGTAHTLAAKLEIGLKQTGELLNYLDIKIKKCELGCF